MKITVLTSSRADYGIYVPLLTRLKEDDYFKLNIIAFGTHTSKDYGNTIHAILADGFEVNHQLETVVGDSPEEIAQSMALTIKKSAAIYASEKIDLLVCLGDRYEMFAAVSASIPFNIPVAHIHGGETTLGAIDNKFRHALTLMASYNFTSAKSHAKKVEALTASKNNYNVGALSLDNLDTIQLLSVDEFNTKFNIDLSIPTILVTFHPETVSFEKNATYAKELAHVFKTLSHFQIVITMPNADTMGNVIREEFLHLEKECEHIKIIENFGLQGYFSAMKLSRFLLGNTSSGIIEAASFNKHVINLGDRQKGRTSGENVHHIRIQKEEILQSIKEIDALGEYNGQNIYKGKTPASQQIIDILKTI